MSWNRVGVNTSKRYGQLRMKDLSKVVTWRIEWDSNLLPSRRKARNPMPKTTRLHNGIITSMSLFLNFRLGGRENPLKGPSSFLGSLGEDTIFNCDSPLKTCDNMTWQRGNGSFGTPIGYSDVGGKYELRDSTSGCQLIITDTQVNDSGPYTCRFMKTFERTAELYVIGKIFHMLCLI